MPHTALEMAQLLADEADLITVDRFRSSDLVVTTKPDLTPVSDADQAVERRLRDMLGGEQVLGEEYGGRIESGRVWVLDPIDGTKNFVRGVPVWATLIALVDDGKPVLGVVSAPALGRRWWAEVGAGSFRREFGGGPVRNRVSAVSAFADASLSYSDSIGWPPGVFEAATTAAWRARAYGDFWSHMMVAEGCVDVAAEPELNIWDVAALIPVVTEAGGRMTGWSGGEALRALSAVTSNGRLHDEFLNLLAAH